MAKSVELEIRAKNLTKEAFDKVAQALKALEDQSEQTTTQGSTSWGKWFSVIGGGVAVGNLLSSAFKTVGGLLASIPGQLLELGKRGSDVADVSSAFKSLTASVGESADAMLGKLRSAFGGTVSDFDLMKSANETFSKGAKLSADGMETIAKAARTMADQVGGNAKGQFDSMLSAIARGNERELKQLPINMANIEKSVKAHAAALGVEESALSQSQKQIALRNAVLSESNRILKEHGETSNDYTDNLVAMEVAVGNWTDRLGEAIATSPQLNVALGRIAEAMQAAFGVDSQEQVKNIAKLVGQVAIAAVNSASFIVGAAGAIASAYYKARSAVDSLFKSFADREVRELQSTVDMYQKMVDRGVQSAKPRLDELKARLDYLKGFAQGLGDDASEAAENSARLSRMAADAQSWLGKLSAEMRIAGDATGETAVKVGDLGVEADGAGAGVSALTAKATKYRQTLKELSAEIANRKDLDDRGLVDRFGKDALKAIQQARDLGISLDQIPPKVREIGEAQGLKDFTQVLASVKPAVLGIGSLITELDKQMFEMTGRSNQGWIDLRDGMIEAQERMTLATKQGTAKRLAEIDAAEKKEIASFAHLRANDERMYQERLKATKAFYQGQRDEANGTADTIEKRMAEQGIFTQQVLDEQAAAATRNYEQMLASGKYSSAQLQVAWQRMVDANLAAQGKWSQTFNSWISAIPGLLQSALTGGGGAGGFAKSLASMIGGDVGGSLFEEGGLFGGLTKGLLAGKGKLAGILGKTFSGALGAALPGIGSAIGALAGPLLGKVGGLFGKLFGFGNKEKKENQEATKQVRALGDELLKTYGSMDNLRTLGKLTGIQIADGFGLQGKKGLAQFQGDVEAFKKKIGEVSAQINKDLGGILTQAEGMGFRLPATLTPYLDKLREMGVLSQENAALLATFGDDSVVSFKKMEEAATGLGIDFEALGNGFNTAKFNESAAQVLEWIDILDRGGTDMGTILAGAADEVSELAQRSMRLGISMPENFRSIAEELIKNGQLLDANGDKITDINKLSFGDPIKIGLERIGDLLEKLLTGLGIDLPNALGRIPRTVDIDINVRENRLVNQRDGGSDTDPFVGSTIDVRGSDSGGLFTKPTFRVFAERQPEVAGSPNAIVDAFAAAMQRTGAMTGGPQLTAKDIADALKSALEDLDTEPKIFVLPTGGSPEELIDQLLLQLPTKVTQNRNQLRTKLLQALGLRP